MEKKNNYIELMLGTVSECTELNEIALYLIKVISTKLSHIKKKSSRD